MDSFLVVGVDTVAGANVAAFLSERYRVSTWTAEPGYEIPHCTALDPDCSPTQAIEQSAADWIILCGPAARSAWDPDCTSRIHDTLVEETQAWGTAARAAGCRIAMISSDAVFTGPWMFHDEQSPGVSSCYQSQTIRAAELQLAELCPNSLILRSNVFGWSPEGEQGWLETMLHDIETERVVRQDHIRHATPILATDLAEILERACQEQLEGTYHVGGAERTNPLRFAQRLADHFELRWLAMRQETLLSEVPAGFGEGECSLQTKAIRLALCVAMPLLSEGLARLKEQHAGGWKDRITCATNPACRRRAA